MWLSLKELAGYAQQDAHEFFISALNQIHADSEGKLQKGSFMYACQRWKANLVSYSQTIQWMIVAA